ncbi:MAG: type II toxin-antitoxin system RelE/ParE family toxin [Candidatus Omnitrophica bacterium]|nr:type II toxin-antitoxin system RelE/ParE family toxin [Candidatus Omnitrophota bacterium]
MIKSFGTKGTEDTYHGIDSKEARKIPQTLWKPVCRKLDMINAAVDPNDLRVPPGNRLEPLKGNLKGKYSIRVNDQYRIVFEFREGNAFRIEITDYH